MIESNIIKRFLVSLFMKNSRLDAMEFTNLAVSTLNSRFFVNESVIVLSLNARGKITRCSKDTYTVALADGAEMEVEFRNLQRKSTVSYDDVLYFFECVTVPTAFGRILIDNVMDRIADIGHPMQPARCLYEPPAPPHPEAALDGGYAYGYEEPKRMRRGRGAARSEPGYPRHERAHGKSTAISSSPDGYMESDGGFPKKGDRPQNKLDLNKLERVAVSSFEGDALRSLVKIYVFLKNFSNDYSFGEFTMQTLANDILDPDYASPLFYNLHAAVIKAVDATIAARKEKYIDSIAFILSGLPEYETDAAPAAPKKRAAFTADNWKQQTKLFLQNLSRETEEDKILQFCEFGKKGSAALRTGLIIFLIDILMLTDSFHSLVNDKQVFIRDEREKYETLCTLKRKKYDTAQHKIDKLMKELDGHARLVLLHPLKVMLGKYQKYTAFIMDSKPHLQDGNEFYVLGKKEISLILCDLDPHIKGEKQLYSNLKACVETLL
ncbi:hypothetical protein PAPHI01_1559 [Pancytospora philotis]|nr:hypothetical protein PAPHI01_1542 [Pancytospora philotis]KAI4292285.1 hypothetical protein PAPHI01_1559 [Pancytospora philotis]